MKVKPKIVAATRELTDAVNILRAFQKKHEAGSKQVFTKKLDYYLDALKFDSSIALAGLDEEIMFMQRRIDETNEARLARIKIIQENMQKSMEQPNMIKELSEALKFSEVRY